MSARRQFLRTLSIAAAGLGGGAPLALVARRDGLCRGGTVRAPSMQQLCRQRGKDGGVALLDRYYPGTEGGGGLFVWREVDPYGRGTDGGMVVSARGGGYWVRPERAVVHAAWFGVGQGADDDTAAMQRACDAVQEGGTLRLDGEITLSDAVTLFGRSVTVEAEGATITMTDGGGYHAFILGGEAERVERVAWSGGTMDGNKAGQNWVDKATGETYGTGDLDDGRRPNHGLLTIRDTDDASFTDVTVRANVMSGLQHLNAGESVTRSCVGTDAGDPAGVYPGTFSSRYGDLALYENCRAEGGNIGFVYTSGQAPPGSHFIVRGCTVKDMRQGAFWCEESEAFLLEDFQAEATDRQKHKAGIYVSNNVRRTHIRRGEVAGGQIDFNNASQQEEGTVEDVRVVGYPGQEAAIHNAVHTKNCTVLDSAGHGIRTKVSENDTVSDFAGRGIEWAEEVKGPEVRNGAVGLFNPGRVEGGTITNVGMGVWQTSGETVLQNLEIYNTRGPAIVARDTAERLVVRGCRLRDFGSAQAQGRPVGVEGGAAEVEITDSRFELTAPLNGRDGRAYQGTAAQKRLVFSGNTVLGIREGEMLQHRAQEVMARQNRVQR